MSKVQQIACPRCNTTNRVPKDRVSDKPNCGKCRSPLFSGQPAELSAGTFQRFISQTDIPVIVDFWAPWCGPCTAMAPTFSKLAQEMEPDVRLAKLDTQQHPLPAQQFNIRSIPTLICFKGGKEVGRVSGALTEPQLRQWIKKSTH